MVSCCSSMFSCFRSSSVAPAPGINASPSSVPPHNSRRISRPVPERSLLQTGMAREAARVQGYVEIDLNALTEIQGRMQAWEAPDQVASPPKQFRFVPIHGQSPSMESPGLFIQESPAPSIKNQLSELLENCRAILSTLNDSSLTPDEQGALFETLQKNCEGMKQLVDELLESRKKETEEDSDLSESAIKNAIAGCVHELRTPLYNMILAFGMGLSNEELKSEMGVTCKELDPLIKQIPGPSASPGHYEKALSVPFTLPNLMADVERTTRYYASSNQVTLIFPENCNEVAHGPVKGDVTKISQALRNLISNAIKYSGSSKVEIRVAKKIDMGSHYLLQFEVCDEGKGISEENQKKLGQIFSQLGDDAKGVSSSGVGLWKTKELVQTMNDPSSQSFGWVSAEGEGSRFWFTAKVKKINTPSQIAPSPSFSKVGVSSLRKGLKILVADDSLSTQKMLARLFARNNAHCDTVSDGESALDAVTSSLFDPKSSSSNDYDIALLDMNMGSDKLTGLDTAKKIQAFMKAHKKKCPPIILCTGQEDRLLKEECARIGVTLLPKPFAPDPLLEQIGKLTN